MAESLPSMETAVAKMEPVSDDCSLYSTLFVSPGSRWSELEDGEVSTRQTKARVPPLEQAGRFPSERVMSCAASLTFVMYVWVEYCRPLRIVSGWEKVMLKRASCTTTAARGVASNGRSRWPGEWKVALTSRSMVYVPGLD